MRSIFSLLRRYAALISLLTFSVGVMLMLADQPDMRFVPIAGCSCSGYVQHNDVPIVFIGEIRAAKRILPSNGSSDQLRWKLDFKVTNAIKGVTQSEYQVWASGICFWNAVFEVGEVLEIRAGTSAEGGLGISPCGGAWVVAPAPTPGTATRATQIAQKSEADADVARATFLTNTGEAAVILMVLSGAGGLIILGALNLSRLALRWNERRTFGRRQRLQRRPVRKIPRPVPVQLSHSGQGTEVERSEQGPDEFGK